MQNAVFFSSCTEPVYNLAVEEVLFCGVREGCTLFLRQDTLNVSIGRNQNARKACRYSLLEHEGGTMLRRYSGGGAMYGDEGTLGFTFITPRGLYDAKKQADTLVHALASLGIGAEHRDGLLVSSRDNMPLSTHAIRQSDTAVMRHGLIYVNADLERMARYLAPSSREGLRGYTLSNISAHGQPTHMEKVKRALIEAFIRQFGPARMGRLHADEREAIAVQSGRLSLADWRYSHDTRYELTLEHRFAFGGVELQFNILEGRVLAVNAYTDAMDTAFVHDIAPALTGCAFCSGELADRLKATRHEPCDDIARWLRTLGF